MAAPGVEGLNPEIERLFFAVADLDPEARRRYLDEQELDAETRQAVERLVEHDRGAATFLGTPLASVAAQIEQATPARVGPYRVIREIGRGGMGAVYEAERSDGELNLRVAVKFVSRAIRSDFIVERFRRERQILANLNHPNICRVIDAGTTEDGLPYLVMELIEGQSVDEWARGRPTREICELFQQVCGAVQHAHQNLVVHRDLKPGNILVTAAGTPKLLDFGIAKLLDNAPSSVQNTIRALTPAYASPEQVAGLPVTTAADVYGLGCVLYHLLTGEAPKRPPGGEIPPASTLRPELRPLDAILERAMRSEPTERYATAREFGGELGRWLTAVRRPVPWMLLTAATAGLALLAAGWAFWRVSEAAKTLDMADATLRTTPEAGSLARALREQWRLRQSRGHATSSGAVAIAEALRNVGDYAGAAQVLGDADANLAGQLALDQGQLPAAAKLAKGPVQAEALRRLGRLSEARNAIQPATTAEEYHQLGRILEDLGDLNQALKAAQRALDQLPGDRALERRLGELLDASGERERARKQFEAIVNRPDSNPLVLSPRLRAERIGDLLRYAAATQSRPTFETAVRQAAELSAEFPADRYARLAHARAWAAEAGRWARADEEYLALLADSPEDADLLREFGANRLAWLRAAPAAERCADGLKRLQASPHPGVALLARQMQQVCQGL